MSITARSIWIGFDPDPRQVAAFGVARHSIERQLSDRAIPIRALILEELQAEGLYWRPTERRLGRCYDVLSKRDDYNGEMSTEFALSRFLVPHLAEEGWALFLDCDMLIQADLAHLFAYVEDHPQYAVYCVKHEHQPANRQKMDGAAQTAYPKKNWSSFLLFNCDHPANKALTLDAINTLPGLDLHRFAWLDEDEIGELGPEYNFLVGHSEGVERPKVLHFTDGVPAFAGCEAIPFADEWKRELHAWAR